MLTTKDTPDPTFISLSSENNQIEKALVDECECWNNG